MTYGLIGYPLSHSFSQPYFTRKFERLDLADTHRYQNFPMETVEGLRSLPASFPDLRGLNVTIPHKQAVIPLLDELDPTAEQIGAVNTILIDDEGRFKGYNTDWIGFRDDLLLVIPNPLEAPTVAGLRNWLAGKQALILGSGGAARGVRAALDDLGLNHRTVSRSPGRSELTYTELTAELIRGVFLIVNTTPLGMSPSVDTFPDVPYAALTADHFCYDIVYNPAETEFMRRARAAGAGAANGLGMLHGQAEAAWKIWGEGK